MNKEIPEILPDTFDQKEIPLERTAAWEAIVRLLAVGVFYAALPSKLIVGPSWLLLIIEVVLLLPIVSSTIAGRGLSHRAIRVLLFILLGIVTLALATGILLLIVTLNKDQYGGYLLRSAALLWGSNVLVFGLWYWQIDGGGPVGRHLAGHQAADFLFPQQANGTTNDWAAHFMDYLFLAFTGATALSPADTMPLTHFAKALMMMEALLSMTVIVVLAGRAVNIL